MAGYTRFVIVVATIIVSGAVIVVSGAVIVVSGAVIVVSGAGSGDSTGDNEGEVTCASRLSLNTSIPLRLFKR